MRSTLSDLIARLPQQQGRLWGSLLAGSALLGLGGWWGYGQLPAMQVGQETVRIADLRAVHDFQTTVAEITGDTPPTRADIAYSMALTLIEQQVLNAQKKLPAAPEMDKALSSEAAAFKGLLATTRGRLGEAGYQRLVVAPLVTPRVFAGYYRQADQSRTRAQQVLNQALREGLPAAASKSGLTQEKITLRPSEENMALGQAILQRWPDQSKPAPVLEKLVDSPEGFMVVQPVSIGRELVVSAIKVPHEPFASVVQRAMKQYRIQVQTPWWSPVSRATLATPTGSVFNGQ